MPPIVAAAIIAGVAGAGTATIQAKSASGANKRALSAQERAAAKAEAFAREQDALQRADDARHDAEEQKRHDAEEAQKATDRAEMDRRQAEQDARQRYEDQIRYRKMVNIARLTGQPEPDPMPSYGGGSGSVVPLTLGSLSKAPVSEPMMAAPSRAKAMIAAPPDFTQFSTMPTFAAPKPFDPFEAQQMARVSLRDLGAMRYS